MADAKGVVFALGPTGKRRNAAPGADGGHPFFATSQYLVRIRLVTDIPNQLIRWRIEYIMQRHGEFDRAQARRKMAAGNAHGMG